ncbi:MAG: SAM-dependent methyltransferase [Desulfococcaceae bacterium]
MKSSKYMKIALAVSFLSFCLLLSAYGENTGKLYVVGMGPAGPDLTAPRVLSIVEKADFILCSPRMPERFARFGTHIDPSKVAFNPWEGIFDDESDKKDPQARAAARQKQQKKVQDFVLEKIKAGKTVVIMDGGDPCVYGPALSHLLAGLDDRHYEVMPGMGAFNAAAAALKRSMTCEDARFVMLTSTQSLFGDETEPKDDILKDISKYKTTMVLYMSLRNMSDLAEKLKPYYAPDLPVAVVYYAGYADKERVLRSTLSKIAEDIKKMDEKWLGLVVIGECIR